MILWCCNRKKLENTVVSNLLTYKFIWSWILHRIQWHDCNRYHTNNNPDNSCTNYSNSNCSIGGWKISRTECWRCLDTNLWQWVLGQWLWGKFVLPTIRPQVCCWNCEKDKHKARIWRHSNRRMHKKWYLVSMYWRMQRYGHWQRMCRLQSRETKSEDRSGM